MKKCLLLLLLFQATIVWSQSTEKIAAAVDRLNAALVKRDSAALVSLTADGLSYGHSSGKVEDRQAFIQAVVNGPFTFQSINTSDQTITRAKRAAVVRHTFIAKATNNGAPADVKLGVLQVWQKQGRTWKLLARQAVKL